MKKLKELIGIVTEEKFIPEGILDFESQENRQYLPYKMFAGIKNGELISDADAAESIYGERTISEKYRRLKWQLKETLYSKLLLINPTKENHSEYFAAFVECSRKIFLVKLLVKLSANKSAEQIGRHVLDKAAYYSLHSIAFESAQTLRSLYQNSGERRLFEEMCEATAKHRQLLVAEDEAAELWQKIGIHFFKSAVASDLKKQSIKENYKKLERLHKKYDDTSIALSYFRAKNVLLQIEKDYTGVVNNCDAAIEHLRNRPHQALNDRYLEFHGTKLNAYREMHDYVNAKFNAQISARYAREGTHNWFRFQDVRFVMSMHAGDFNEAGTALQMVHENERFEDQPQPYIERWRLYEGYYSLAGLRNDFTPPQSVGHRVEKLMSQTPTLQKDKEGWNTSLIILQLVTYIKRGQVDQILDRLDSLSQYCHKYLYKNETYRTQVFIRMLLVVAKENLHYRRVERLGRQWVSKLKRYKDLYDETEIVPYEEVWGWVLQSLKGNKELVADYKVEKARRKAS